jgi:DNA-binding CsgD family transcriptional regulator/tetratricopeptide (TPR) repeat protein
VDSSDALERGRTSHGRREWPDAYDSLSRADQAAPLGAEDVVLLATAAFMVGRDDEWMSGLERAHHLYEDAGEPLRAVRCAFWIGMNLALRGEVGPATGWLARAHRLLEREERDSVERGYLMLPTVFQHEANGDLEAAAATAGEAAEVGERFGDADLFAIAVHAQGTYLVRHGRVREGLGLLDEAMVAVTTRKLSPPVTGLVYCGVILACQEVYEVRRAKEWTAALTRWCEQQPGLVAFTGRCLVHRAEIMQLRGAWPDALAEARRAGERLAQGANGAASARAFYLQAELHRLQGQFDAAETAYREASRYGWEPQPGVAQLRLAQGRIDAAAAAIRRVSSETTEPLRRAGLLPAYVEIMLAAGEIEEARTACGELEAIAENFESAMLGAMLAHARGAVALAEGDYRAALVSLRQALRRWQELEAPYDAARARVLLALACRALGDGDAVELELEAARSAFAELGAAPDLARVAFLGQPGSGDFHGLTPRELEVLRLVAAGKSNREIASALVISEHTVARHVQNIFAKLDVSSRTAAGAFAFEHDLV